MKFQLRSIGFGLLTAMVGISVVEALGHMVYPVAENMDYNNKELMKSFIATLPFGALVFVVNAWIIGSMAGGFVATKMHQKKGRINALIVGALVLVFTFLNMLMIPHPLWMWLSGLIGIIPAAWFGHIISAKKS